MHGVDHPSDADRVGRAFGVAAFLIRVACRRVRRARRERGRHRGILERRVTRGAPRALLDDGLAGRACANGLRWEGIEPGSVNRYVEIVASNVVHVAELQDRGWAASSRG